MKTKLEKLQTKLNLKTDEALVVFSPMNIRYISEFSGHAATLLITQNKSYLITDYRYYEQALTQTDGMEVICRDRANKSIGDVINELLDRHEIKLLKFEADHISYAQWQQILNDINVKQVKPVLRSIEDLRYIKTTEEIHSIQQAAAIADQALENMLSVVKDKVTEKELATELEYQMSQLGSEEMSFATIIGFAERSALPHAVPTNKKLNHGDIILIDFGAVCQGYHSDMTRTFIFGKASEKQKEVHQWVSRAQQAAFDAIELNMTGEQLFLQSEKVLLDSPYAQYRGEGLGHGVGLDLHEFPFMAQGCDLKIINGCVITIEPGIYIPKWGGVRIEDDIAITQSGVKMLNTFPRELIQL